MHLLHSFVLIHYNVYVLGLYPRWTVFKNVNLSIFSWRTIALQCCVGSDIYHHEPAKVKHTSVSSLLIFPPTSHYIPPLQVVTELWVWAPCIIQQISTDCLILHVVMYKCQCHSLNSSHPLLPSLCPQVCSLGLYLHCCPADAFISTIFLDSIYMCQYMIFVFLFLTYFTLYNSLWFHPPS